MDGILLYGEPAIRGEDLLNPPAWHALAACAGEDTEAFYPERDDGPDAIAHALDVCADCPARAPCLAWALEHEEAGVWGGTTDADRRHIRRGEPVPERKPVRTAPAAPERPTRRLAPCGTTAAYARHLRRGEDACDACREANRLKSAEANRKRREHRQEAA